MASDTPASHVVVSSPNAPRPDDPEIVCIADTLRRIESNYAREGSGPGSRFEGRLLEDVQAEAVVRMVREACARLAEQCAAERRWANAIGAMALREFADLIRARTRP